MMVVLMEDGVVEHAVKVRPGKANDQTFICQKIVRLKKETII